ncbi:TetR/AcrR family transcriptional regulator [Bacteroides sp. 519]|uniref:TetR/AcrR family transcriptional regulator n=1 Tax=Bacteroides sp. 519 TaxID=2302937 RepID=UPI0013D2534C|nr:TetR/AcrR family transcriptional regulator [Bacteroides sp. 519]NDV59456.1 TetR/AcrR family transcriptional regulator [Bacteroides sp. 519]
MHHLTILLNKAEAFIVIYNHTENKMQIKETENEKLILEAAEAEFLEKGYAKSRTTEIAKRAGLTHAMLHYYFRTKENLFEVVFQRKAKLMSEILLLSFKKDLPFLDKIRNGIEDHFDLIAANEKLPSFIFNEVRHDDNLRRIFVGIVKERASLLLANIKQDMETEVARGTIHYMNPYDLLYNIISLNAFVFMSAQVMCDIMDYNEEQKQKFLEHRKQMNVETVLNQLRI